MSRTRRRDPGGCWLRKPRSKGARVNREAADDALVAEGLAPLQRRQVPPDAWDDLLVSYHRGQAWARRDRIRG